MTDDGRSTPLHDGITEDGSPAGPWQRLAGKVKALLRIRSNGSARRDIEDAIAADEQSGAAFSPEERNMLRAILKLGDLRVEDVMVPRADIDAAEINVPIARLLVEFGEAGHSRLPVYRETLDDPIGMVHIKDIMKWILETAAGGQAPGIGEDGRVSLDLGAVDLQTTLHATGMARPVLFVPPSMPARMLLERMQASRTQMALVIDEYGGTDGLVSLEDLMEIIVGEIEDEHDEAEEEATIVKVGDGLYVADARADIEDAVEMIGPTFDVGEFGEDADTIGGLVYTAAGRIPVRGEIIHPIANFEFEILDADPRRIKKIRIRERRKLKTPLRNRPRSAAPASSEPANDDPVASKSSAASG